MFMYIYICLCIYIYIYIGIWLVFSLDRCHNPDLISFGNLDSLGKYGNDANNDKILQIIMLPRKPQQELGLSVTV